MFGFEITSDLLIVAIFAQTIAISLIILTIYFKIQKIHYKNIDLQEKIDEKLDRVESKLSYLYNQVLVISANQDKFNCTKSSLDPSTYYRTSVPSTEESGSQSLFKDTILYGQNSMSSRIAESRQTATVPKDSETRPIPAKETSSFSPLKSEPAITTTSSSPTSNHHSFSEISTNNKRSDDASKDTATDFVQNSKESTNTNSFADTDRPIEKNSNPEIDKIEKEILTALKRLGGDNDVDGYGDSSREDFIYPTAKKSDRKVKNID
ncbi:hypothetical protein [Candidatus Nitrosocosmicus sp. R]